MVKHRWDKEDDIVGLYLYLYGEDLLNKNMRQITEYLGMGLDSMRYKISNYSSLDGGPGLDHASAQSIAVYKKYRKMNQKELAKIVNEIIE